MTDPRLLLIDFTPMTGPAATSALKAAYFRDWADGALIHVSDVGGRVAAASGMARPQFIESDDAAISLLIGSFAPEVVLYRPVADSPALHDFAMRAIEKATGAGAGLALWLMDDWPARLEKKDAAHFEEMDRDLRLLLGRAGVRFAISDGMAGAFEDRYGAPFDVAHNGVLTDDWPARNAEHRERLVVRYAGSLAPDTTRDSVLDVARAVADLAGSDAPVVLEGRSHKIWLKQSGEELNALPNVSFAESDLSAAAYREWLCGADILLLAYNFDEHTRTYLQYSFANKLPETMAAGAAILAYGPDGLETIDYLKRNDLVEAVTSRDPEQLRDALLRLAHAPARRRELSERARSHAFSSFEFTAMKAAFKEKLSRLIATATDSGGGVDADAAIKAIAKKEPEQSFPGAGLLAKIRRRLSAR